MDSYEEFVKFYDILKSIEYPYLITLIILVILCIGSFIYFNNTVIPSLLLITIVIIDTFTRTTKNLDQQEENNSLKAVFENLIYIIRILAYIIIAYVIWTIFSMIVSVHAHEPKCFTLHDVIHPEKGLIPRIIKIIFIGILYGIEILCSLGGPDKKGIRSKNSLKFCDFVTNETMFKVLIPYHWNLHLYVFGTALFASIIYIIIATYFAKKNKKKGEIVNKNTQTGMLTNGYHKTINFFSTRVVLHSQGVLCIVMIIAYFVVFLRI